MLAPLTIVTALLFAPPPGTTEALLEGVTSIASPGAPGTLVVWGEDATPVLAVSPNRVVAAAATLARGRVVALGHGGYASPDDDDTARFLANGVRWAAGFEPTDDRPVRVAGANERVLEQLRALGVAVEAVGGQATRVDLDAVDVLIAGVQSFNAESDYKRLERFVRRGGGLIATDTAWGYMQLNRAPTVHDLPCNRLLADAGLAWTQVIQDGTQNDRFPVSPAPGAAHAGLALDALEAGEGGPGHVQSVAEVLRHLPADSSFSRRVERVLEKHRDEIEAAYASMVDRPLTPQRTPLAVLAIDLDSAAAQSAPARRVRAHPSAAAFPGAVADEAERVNREVDLTGGKPGWRTTGLYAAPGDLVRVRIDRELVGRGLVARIGPWLDPQNFDQRVRLRNGSRTFELNDRLTEIASAMGGAVYIDVPPDLAGETLEIAVMGAVEMPHFKLGVTTPEEWARLRDAPAPFAEMETDELVFSLPSSAVRGLDDPTPVMEHWDRVHAAMDRLQPRSPNHWPDRQYRYVAERRLSWGYMYCPQNAPVVIPDSAAARMMAPANFDAEGENRLWGHYHEMGHAHQDRMWTFGGTGEVTVNIFTVYALHKVNGYPLDHEVMRSDPKRAWERFEQHKAEGAPFDKWRSDPFLALQMYALLWHEFGFESYENVFAAYRGLPANRRPGNDAEKRDMWMVMFSREVGRDLGPYFDAWGVPVSGDAKAMIADLPVWMPRAPGASTASR